MMFYFGLLCLIIGIGLFMFTTQINDQIYSISSCICATIFTVFAIILIMIQTADNCGGYSVGVYILPINSVCEIVYVGDEVTHPDTLGDTTTIYYPTLIKLPDNQLRLFDLDQKMALGLAKVMPDFTLIQFSPIPAVTHSPKHLIVPFN